MDVKERALQAHEKWGGKIEVVARCEVNSKDDLSIAYTPGVAEPCLKIKDDPSLSYTYTRRHNLVAVITDGTAVLGSGRYRSDCRHAGHGGQVRAVQGVR